MNHTTGKMIRLPALEKPVYNAEEDRRLAVVGKRISKARKAKGVKMRELQKLLQTRGVEVGYASLFRWENGETVPNAYQLLAICDALEIPDFYTYFMNNNVELNAEGTVRSITTSTLLPRRSLRLPPRKTRRRSTSSRSARTPRRATPRIC